MNEGDTMSLSGPERARMRELADPGPYGWTDHEWGWYQSDVPELLDELERTEKQLVGAVATLERIRDHANSAEDPALLAQHELNRIQRKNPA